MRILTGPSPLFVDTTRTRPARFRRAGWGAASVFDSVRRRLVVFGGMAGGVVGDTWALSLDGPPRWTRIADQALFPPRRVRRERGLRRAARRHDRLRRQCHARRRSVPAAGSRGSSRSPTATRWFPLSITRLAPASAAGAMPRSMTRPGIACWCSGAAIAAPRASTAPRSNSTAGRTGRSTRPPVRPP